MGPTEPLDEPGDMTAAELALGVLDGRDRADALRRLLSDPAFAHEVAEWRARLDGLFLTLPSVEPGSAVDRRVLAGIRDPAPPKGVGAGRWKAATALSTAAAAALLGVLILRPTQPPAPPAPLPARVVERPLVAVIAPQKGEPFSALYDRASGEVRLTGAVVVPRGRAAELWAIGADGVPQALGLIADDTGRGVRVRSVTVRAGTTLAISIEPEGGSPGPLPTGPVVATGKLVIA